MLCGFFLNIFISFRYLNMLYTSVQNRFVHIGFNNKIVKKKSLQKNERKTANQKLNDYWSALKVFIKKTSNTITNLNLEILFVVLNESTEYS